MADLDYSPLASDETMARHLYILERQRLDLKIASDGFPELREMSAEPLCRNLCGIRGQKRRRLSDIFSAASAVYCHEFYFRHLAEKDKYPSLPSGDVASLLEKSFGSVGNFFYLVRTIAAGSDVPGFLWLCKRGPRKDPKLGLTRLPLYSLPNFGEVTPLLCIDLWEHAYTDCWGRDISGYADACLRQIRWEMAFSPMFKSSP